ncbi:ANTAR domain-containing protein [Streptomyces sp. NBC_00237]|uniref:ANTAR domain-containing protein n=1 Tax=Streptomyces sp. NBC_00237 TaxID=2975687 RepID=UPI002253BA61|nr:ANTAR domain-containing protein [Streptomyces sp. NBC_00237]MCX5200190.1 ANTAR domain-containing protein [Streptomyces sp. NBC_00237]
MDALRDAELTALLGTLDVGGGGPDPSWATRCARLLELDGLSVSTQAGSAELLWYSGDVSARLDDLQFTLGEGPSVEAATAGSLLLVTDVRRTPGPRWPAFVPGAAELGVRAVFAFPLRLGAISIGAMTGYRREPHPLSEKCLDAALTLCDALTVYLLSGYLPPAREGDPPGPAATAGAARTGPYENGQTEQPAELHRAVVHQASGMLSIDLKVDLATALDRLRAYAFAHNRPIVAVSRDIVARRLRLTVDRPEGRSDA